jgi:ferredoxin
MRINVDLDLCQGHGACAEEAPEVFSIDQKQAKVVVRDESPGEALRAKVKAAVRFCPTRALALIDD